MASQVSVVGKEHGEALQSVPEHFQVGRNAQRYVAKYVWVTWRSQLRGTLIPGLQVSVRPTCAQRRDEVDRLRSGRRSCCSPRHKVPLDTRNEESYCVSMTWRAVCDRP
jgi:hypothetical protein